MRVKLGGVIFLLLLMFGVTVVKAVDRPPIAVNGEINLEKWDLVSEGKIRLDGEWEFYWDRILTPDDFVRERKQEKNFNMKLPGVWSQYSKTETYLTNSGKATMRLVVKLDRDYDVLSLDVPVIGSAYRLWINERRIAEVGVLDPEEKVAKPALNTKVITFAPNSRTVELIINIGNVEPIFSGTTKSIELGLPEQVNKTYFTSLSLELFLLGSIVIISIYHFILFFSRRKDISILFFSLLCVFVALQTVFYDKVFYNIYFENIHWVVTMKGYMISTSLAFVSLLLYVRKVFPKENNEPVFRCILAGILLGTVITFVMPIYHIALVSTAMNIAILVSLVYLAIVFGKASVKREEGAFVTLITGAVVIGTIVLDLLYSFHVTQYDKCTTFGAYIFLLFQAFVLSKKYAKAFSKTEKLARENTQMFLEIKELNKNLEWKVQKRTEDLRQTMVELEKNNQLLQKEMEEHKKVKDEIVAAYQHIELLSRTDYLTKLLNRQGVEEKMEENVRAFHEENVPFSVCICDVDNFKNINDTYGHNAGDMVLCNIADILRKTVGKFDIVGRWGGEEFILILDGSGYAQVQQVIERARAAVEESEFVHKGIHIGATMTFGICAFDEMIDMDICIARADKALYIGKNSGKNRIVLFSEV